MKRKAGLSILAVLGAVMLYTFLPFVIVVTAIVASKYSETLFEWILLIGGPLSRIIPVVGFIGAMWAIWRRRPTSDKEFDNAA